MAAEHDDFIGLIGAGNFRDSVVAGLALGINMIDDIELELHIVAIRDQPFDAPVIVVAEDYGGNGLRDIVSAMRLGHNDSLASRGIVNAEQSASAQQHR